MKLETAFATLLAHYGTHTDAALALGYSPRHYRELRGTPESKFPKRSKELILLRAEAAEHESKTSNAA